MELIKKRIHYVREGKKIFDQFYVDDRRQKRMSEELLIQEQS